MRHVRRRVRIHLSYANVMSTLAMGLALGGGVAAAAIHLSAGSVTSKSIRNGAVTAAKIHTKAVTAAKLANNAVTGPKLANSAVTGPKIANKAVAGAQLADNAVGNTQLADGAVTGTKLSAGAVSTGIITDAAVTGAKLAPDTVTGANVDEGSLHFSCTVGTATLLLGGPCTARLTTAGSTWQDAIDICQTIDPGATLPTPAQVMGYARLGGVPWKNGIFWTSDLSGSGPPASGAWQVQTDADGNPSLEIATPLSNTSTTSIACVYDAPTAPRPGS
jgi:hypothetical protein